MDIMVMKAMSFGGILCLPLLISLTLILCAKHSRFLKPFVGIALRYIVVMIGSTTKCLGHSVGLPDNLKPRQIQYADDTLGMVREQSEANFLSIKNFVANLHGPADVTSGAGFSCGFLWGEYYSCPEDMITFKDQVISFYWCHSKLPMSGFEVFKNITEFEIPERVPDCSLA